MKKTFCISFLLFATTMCFSAPAGKTDRAIGTQISTTTLHDIPTPDPGCPKTTGECPIVKGS